MLFLRVLFPVRVHVLCSPIQVSAPRFIGIEICHTYKAQPSSPSSSSSSSLNMSSAPLACVKFLSSAKKSSLLSSLSSLDPKSWIISFGKFISQYLSYLHLINSFQPDLQYYLSLGTQSPLAISQYQTPKAHIIMAIINRTAMTSTSKSLTIAFGSEFYCEP